MTEPHASPSKQIPNLPDELVEKVRQARRAIDALPPAGPGRLPVWVTHACLGAGVLAAGLLAMPGCGGRKQEAEIPRAPAGLESALMKPDAETMEPAANEPGLESQDPMDPVPGEPDPPPGSMKPLPPPTRGSDPREDVLRETLVGSGADPNQVMGLSGLGVGGTYGAPPMSFTIGAGRSPNIRFKLTNSSVGLDPNEVRAVLRAHRREVDHCYQKGIMQDPDLSGELQVSFQIDGAGRAQNCKVDKPLKIPEVGTCVCTRMATWRFPTPEKLPGTVTAVWTLGLNGDPPL